MNELVLVKLGGSLITDKARSRVARGEVITRLAEELAAARTELAAGLLLGHGSGSFGHAAAAEHRLGHGPVATDLQRRGVAATQVAAAHLHRQVVDALAAAGASPYSLAPSALLTTTAGRVSHLHLEPVTGALGLGLVPVVYGDVVIDQQWGAAICATETVLLSLAADLQRRGHRIREALWLGETPGILDAQGETVPRLTAGNLERVRTSLGDPRGTDVTGGMRLRLDSAWALAGLGVPSRLLDGLQPGLLRRALGGRPVPGTEIPAR